MENEKIEKIIKKYRCLTDDVTDLQAMNALDLKQDFVFIDLLAVANKDDIKDAANALLLATKFGYLAGIRDANQERT